MYSKKIEALLKAKKIRAGDAVKIEKSGKTYEGILMPQTGAGDPETLVLKLGSGYNMGINFEGAKIWKIAGRKETEVGKTKGSLLKINFDLKKPPVSMVATGGTIASRVDYKTGGVHMQMDPKEFLYNVPELAETINLKKILNPFNIASEDMDHTHWQKIAKVIAKELNSGAKGVIVTHGTDFLHMTAAALSFFLRNLSKPVVLVGAQRSSDRGSSDAGVNLICSAHIAVSDIAEVGICMHGSVSDDYCFFSRGTKVRKMDTQRRDAFRSINEPPIAKIFPDGKIEILNRNYRKRNDKGKVELDAKFEPKVAILKAYPGSDPSIIDYMVSKSCRGFVIEASGLGHVPTNGKLSWIPTIKKHVKDGIPFVTAAQTIYGRLNPNVYTNLRILYKEAGAICGEDMLSEVAYAKLGWVLGHTKDMDKVKEMMLTNFAGEITKRSREEEIGV